MPAETHISAEEFFSEKFKDSKNTLTSESGRSPLISNYGEISEDQVDSLLYLIETKLERAGERKGIIKRIFNIVVEGLQNVRIHGIKTESGKQMSYTLIVKDEKGYLITFANLTENQNVKPLNERLEHLKKMKVETIKKDYLNVLTTGKISEKGGAGLGFITIAIKSDNSISYEFKKVNERVSLFLLNVRVATK